MDRTTGQLADFAIASSFSNLTAEAVHECKRRIIDTFACALGAYDEPLSRMARAVAGRCPGMGVTASVWGSTARTAPEMAAFANGVMLRVLDLSDMYRVRSGGHPSDVIAGIWAAAEVAHSDGPSVINAITLAYDAYCGFCESIDINTKGWDQPVYGIVSGTLGAGKLLGLDREQMAHAVSLSLVSNMALLQARRGELSSWKGCAAANASRNALFAALLARDGFTGPEAIFAGKGGVWNVFGEFDWQLNAHRDHPHGIARTDMKSFPACYHVQSAAWAAIELRKTLNIHDISDIRIETYQWAYQALGSDPTRWAPATRETADHSFPYVTAVALIDGEITSQSFAGERLRDPQVKALMQKVKVEENPAFTAAYPESSHCRLTVDTVAGNREVASIRYPKGHISNPLSDEDLNAKFRSMFKAFGDEQQCSRVLERLWSFEKIRDIADLSPLLEKNAG